MTDGDRALDFDGVSSELAALGLGQRDGKPYSRRQIERMCLQHKLPFFKTPDRRRMIMRSTLLDTVSQWQVSARREMANAKVEAAQARRPKRRN